MLKPGGKTGLKTVYETGTENDIFYSLLLGIAPYTYHIPYKEAFATSESLHYKNKLCINCVPVNKRNENLKTFNEARATLQIKARIVRFVKNIRTFCNIKA